jgi:hypothetical protein
MKKSPASANAYGSAKRGRRCLDRGGYHGEGGDKEWPGEGRGGPEPVRRFAYNAEYVCEGGGRSLRSGETRERGAGECTVGGWAPSMLEGAAYNRRNSMIPGHRLAAVEGLAEGDAGWGEKRAPPRDDAAEFTLPHHVRGCLTPLAAGAPHLGEHGTEGERASGAERAAAATAQHNAHGSGPPSTRASIAMDGGVADTTRANKLRTSRAPVGVHFTHIVSYCVNTTDRCVRSHSHSHTHVCGGSLVGERSS